MGGHAKTGHIDADDAHAIDGIGQQLQRHAGCGGHAQIGDHDGVIFFRIGHLEHRFANVFKQLAGHQCFRIERHIAHGAAGAIKMAGEGQAINAAGRTGQDGGGAAHAQAHAQAAERRAHGLRLVMRPLGIIRRITFQHFGFAGLGGGFAHGVGPGMAAGAFRWRSIRHDGRKLFRHCRTPLPGWAWFRKCRRADRPGWPASG